MEFLVFSRADSALLVVPALFQPPLACRRTSSITLAAVCDLELDDFAPDVVAALARDGFASIRGPDLERVADAICLEVAADGS